MEAETCTCTEVARPAPPSIYCETPIGKDTTGNFSLSYKGVAVRTDCNRFVAFRHHKEKEKEVELYDVTGLTLSGCDALIYRVPVEGKHVKPGDLLLISDCPFQVLHVVDKPSENKVTGVTASGEELTFNTPKRLGDCARYIRIISVLDACGIPSSQMSEDHIALIAALLCCSPCGSGNGYNLEILSNTLASNLLPALQSQLPLLLALQQGQCLESFILTRALQGRIDAPCPPPEKKA